MEAVPFQPETVLRNPASLLGVKVRDKGLTLRFETDPALPATLIGDPLRLNQVLVNLVCNAIKFTSRGEIVVTTEVVEEEPEQVRLRFTVQDSGIGMSSEQIKRLFNPFSQADVSTTRFYGGSGLGLVISRKLVERMGGTIGVESVEGKGSRFFFTALFGRPAPPLAGDSDREVRGHRILVVEDCPASRDILRQLLETFNNETTAVATGEEALSALQEASPPYDLVLMDWQLPGLDGPATIKKIRQSPTIAALPKIILVSGYDEEKVRRQAMLMSLDGFLVKPVSRAKLLAEIEGALLGRKSTTTAEPPGPPRPLAPLTGNRVLVAEDNEINRQVARELLESWGIEAVTADSGSAAVAMAAAATYDAILMDIQMPGMDGLTATKAIRDQEPASRHVPIIAMTAHAMVGDREKSLAAGMDDHVNKPLDPVRFHATLARWLPRTRTAPAGKGGPTPPLPPPRRTEPFACLQHCFTTAKGLARTSGNHDIYGNLLALFVKNHAEASAEMEQSLAANDFEALQSQSHALKGVAGTVGAEKLQTAALGLEMAARAQNHAEAEATLTAVARELDEVLTAIATFQKNREAASGQTLPGQGKAGDDLGALLEQLTVYLEEGNTKAARLVEPLREKMRHSGFAEEIEALVGLVASYEFDVGLEYLRDLRERMRTPPASR